MIYGYEGEMIRESPRLVLPALRSKISRKPKLVRIHQSQEVRVVAES